MSRRLFVAVVFSLALVVAPPTFAGVLSYQTVDFSSFHNSSLQGQLYPGFPAGNMTLGGVPFDTPTAGNNFWRSYNQPGPNPREIVIPVGVNGVHEVHTLINTEWGQCGEPALTVLEFTGSEGAVFVKPLIGDVDIRDWSSNSWCNNINGTSTVNVFSESPDGTERRLDKQLIELPPAFQSQVLTSIKLSDMGFDGGHRTFLYGVTVAVPEPSALALAFFAGLLPMMRRRANPYASNGSRG